MAHPSLAQARLRSQRIEAPHFRTPGDVTRWMGAIQAQDFAMSKWAMGLRMQNATDAAVEKAIARGEIIRTHVLRPTWHWVSAEDIRWMLALTASRIRSSMGRRLRELELTPAVLLKSKTLLVNALTGGKHLGRYELTTALRKARIRTDGNRLSHILFHAELEALLCSGATRSGHPTYALLDERVKGNAAFDRGEAAARLADRYFTSRAPATLLDFSWWSGLPLTDARRALDMIRERFSSKTMGGHTYWFPASFSFRPANRTSVFLLPAFDEFVISYRDRGAIFNRDDHTRAISSNGIFHPAIVIDGQVTGVWKRTVRGGRVIVETALLRPHTTRERSLTAEAARSFGAFLEKTAAVTTA
ncbi:MAG: winged helix DNA-binding domain-containing protein [Vicinamibacterales bacterium]